MLIQCYRLFLLLICFGLPGCVETISSRSLPAPLKDEVPYQLQGRARRYFGGDNFELGSQSQEHYILLRGVDAPNPGQPYHHQARNFAMRCLIRRQLEVDIVYRDEAMRELGDVYVLPRKQKGETDKLNLALELLKKGLAWFDGSEFKFAETYRAAEAEAREKKIGLWSQAKPIPPWEHYDEEQEQVRAEIEELVEDSLQRKSGLSTE